MITIKRKHHRHRPHSKLAERRKKLLFFKIGGIVAILLLIVVGIVFALRAERINIVDINIKGNSAVATKAIKRFAEDKISGNYVYVFPKSSILLYPREYLQATLLENFKEIRDVNVSSESLQSISINIKERKPYALYCGEYVEQQTEYILNIEIVVASSSPEISPKQTTLEPKESVCYFLDENSLIFTKAPDFSGNVFFRYYKHLVGEDLIGQQFMPANDFKEMNFFLASLIEIGLKPIVFNVIDENDFEVKLESGGKILFGKKQSLSSIFDNIQSVFESEEFDKDNLSILDYADFRFGNKVYFKFK